MTVNAVTLVLTDLATGRVLGQALVCPDARYASIAWHGADRLDRRHPTPALWKRVEEELSVGVPAGPLESTSAFAEVLLEPERRRSVAIQYVAILPIDAKGPETTVNELDGLLRSMAPDEPGPAGG